MTIEEISVKFTADTNALKKALSDITETLKGTEAQTMDIASVLDEIKQPIKDMSKDFRTLTEQSAAYNKQMTEVTKTVSGTGKAVGEVNSKMQTVSKQSTAETAKITTGWKKVKETMQDVFKSRPTANLGGNTSSGGGVRSYKVSSNPADAAQEKVQKALDAEQAKLQKLQNTLNGYEIKLDAVNQKYDIQNQKVQKTSNDIQVQQTKLDGLKKDYETMSSIMSEMGISDSINAEMSRLKTTLDENKISANELFDAMERLKKSPYDIIDVGNSFMSMEEMTAKMDMLDASSEKAWGSLEKIETAMEGVSAESRNFGSAQGLQRMNSVITQQENKLRALQNIYNTASSQTNDLNMKQELLSSKMQQSRESIQSAKDRIAQLGEALQHASAKTSTGFFGRLASSARNVGNAAASLIHRFQNGVSHVKNFGTALLGAGRKLSELYSRFSLVGRMMSSFRDKMQGLTQTFRMAKSIILSMALMAVMSGMNELLQSFAKQSSMVNDDLSALSSSFTYLRSSILSAFQPLLGYITPILTSIVNSVADAFNKLAEFIAYLTGQSTFEKAIYTQKNYSASLSESAASAKELQNVLLGFDEITKLDDNNSGSGGSGAGGAEANTGNWETTQVNISSSLAESIKNGNWESVGSAISDKLSSAMESIDWNKAYEKAKNFGTNLAKFLNGLITPRLFKNVGKTIAGALNTVLYAVFSFSKEFKWHNFGNCIRLGIDKFLRTYDFKTAGFTVGNITKGIATSVYALVSKKSTWTLLGTKIGTGISGFFKSMGTKDDITGMNGWQTLAADLSGIANGIITALCTAIKTVPWEDVGTAIGDFISGIEWSKVAMNLWKLAKEVISALGKALKGLTNTSPLATAVLTVLAGLKLAKSVGLGTKILNTIGSSVLAGNATGLTNALGLKIGACVTTAVAGFKIGNWLYENNDTVQNVADTWVEKSMSSAWKMITGHESEADYAKYLGGLSIDRYKFNKYYGTNLTNEQYKFWSEQINNPWDIDRKTAFDKERKFYMDLWEKTNGKKDKSWKTLKKDAKSTQKEVKGKTVTYNAETATNGTKTTDNSKLFSLSNSFSTAWKGKNAIYNAKTATNGKVDTGFAVLKSNIGAAQNSFTSKDVAYNAETKFNGQKVVTTTGFKVLGNSYTATWKGKSVGLDARTEFNGQRVVTTTGFKVLGNSYTATWKGKNVGYNARTTLNGVRINTAGPVRQLSDSMKNGFSGKTVDYNIKTQSDSDLESLGKNAADKIFAGMSAKTIKLTLKNNGGNDPLKNFIDGSYSLTATYATGGFPEDGVFMANHGELVGQFSNGKTAVANNKQIVDGIEAGVYRAVTAANSSGGGTGGNTPVVYVYVGGKQVTDVVIKDINDRTVQTGKNPLLI